MSAYTSVKSGKLKLKGDSSESHRKKKRKRRSHDDAGALSEPGFIKHGRWRKVRCFEEIGDRVILESGCLEGQYIQALDNGFFKLGPVRADDESPDPSEVFMAVRLSETKVAFKSGYGRYLGVDSSGELVGQAEAVGPRETWEPVFEDTKLALCACTHRFMTVTSDLRLMAASEKAKEREIFLMRGDVPLSKKARSSCSGGAEEVTGDMESFEVQYVKKFQSFRDHKLRVCSESRDGLTGAKEQGKLHEALLDRREKMKADRYCK